MFRTDNHPARLSEKRRALGSTRAFSMGSHIVVTAVSTTGLAAGRGPTAIFHLSNSVTSSVASATPAEVRPAGGMNRWTLESLLINLGWILPLAAAYLLIAFGVTGLGAAVMVVVVIFLSAGVAVVWSEARRARKSR